MPQTAATVGVRYMIDDVADAIAFYTTHLGFTVEHDAAPAFAAVSRDGGSSCSAAPTSSGRRAMPDGTRPVPGGWNRLHLQVADLAGEVDRLRAAGCRFRNDIIGPGGSQILLEDPPATWSNCSSPPGEAPPLPQDGPGTTHAAAASAERHVRRLAAAPSPRRPRKVSPWNLVD